MADNCGIVFYKTLKALVVATYAFPASAADCLTQVSSFADYLISMQM